MAMNSEMCTVVAAEEGKEKVKKTRKERGSRISEESLHRLRGLFLMFGCGWDWDESMGVMFLADAGGEGPPIVSAVWRSFLDVACLALPLPEEFNDKPISKSKIRCLVVRKVSATGRRS
jgi:hypothetical protein